MQQQKYSKVIKALKSVYKIHGKEPKKNRRKKRVPKELSAKKKRS